MTEIVFVGRPSPEKGLADLLWALMHCRQAEWRLHVAGERVPLPPSVQSLVDAIGSERIRFYGPVPNRNVADMMRRSDVVVVPSHYETFGNVALEAMACGCVVIAARTGGLRDLVTHGVTGFHFPAGDRAALANLLEDVIAGVARLGSVRLAAATAARAFSWVMIAERTGALLHRVIECDC